MLEFGILKIYNIRNRIPYSVTDQHQCHTSCNSENCHKQTFLVAEQVSKRGFPCKIQMFPEERHPLQKDSPAFFWCRWTHQGCRCLCQRTITWKYSCPDSTDQCRHRSSQCILKFIMDLQCFIYIMIHHSISFDNDKRQYLFADQDTDNTASCSRQKCIA